MACKWNDGIDREVDFKKEFDGDHIYDVIPSGEIDDDLEVGEKLSAPRKIKKVVSDPTRLPLANLDKEERRQYYRLLIDILDAGVRYNHILNGLTGPEPAERRMRQSYGLEGRRAAIAEKDRLYKMIRDKVERFNRVFSKYLEQELTLEWVVLHARKRHVETIKKTREAGEIIPFWKI
ncbi:hypothetical protein IKH83_00835 [Candidatus Saccharibacteria bacterium]|nr:hypothetical protein [Candidatus Saccharibacteria bacterium]